MSKYLKHVSHALPVSPDRFKVFTFEGVDPTNVRQFINDAFLLDLLSCIVLLLLPKPNAKAKAADSTALLQGHLHRLFLRTFPPDSPIFQAHRARR